MHTAEETPGEPRISITGISLSEHFLKSKRRKQHASCLCIGNTEFCIICFNILFKHQHIYLNKQGEWL